MKGVLKCIFGEKSYMNILIDDNISNEPIIKEEDSFYAAQKKYKNKNKKLNPLTKQGKVSLCTICDSVMHWEKAVIDTACTKAVAGQLWLQNYMKNLDDASLKQVEISESHKVFKFGDGCKVIVTSKAKLPAQIGNTKCFIKAEIIQEKILLLLSKTSV